MPVLERRLHFWFAGWVGALLVRALRVTWRVRILDPAGVAPGARDGSRPLILAFWHRHLLSLLAAGSGYPICVPVSEHRDGEYVAQVMHRFGLESVRGSTTRGSIRLLKGMLARAREGWTLAVTPDGPRGPRFSVQPGVALLARRSGLPVHPLGVAVGNAWVARSWDAFVVPKPGTRIAIAIGPAVAADPAANVNAFCEALREALFAATATAEQALAED